MFYSLGDEMKCCKDCPEYDLCEEKKGCCDMCDFYNPKTKKCANKRKKKTDEEILSRKKVEEEEAELLEDADELNPLEEDYELKDPYEEDAMDEFFDT